MSAILGNESSEQPIEVQEQQDTACPANTDSPAIRNIKHEIMSTLVKRAEKRSEVVQSNLNEIGRGPFILEPPKDGFDEQELINHYWRFSKYIMAVQKRNGPQVSWKAQNEKSKEQVEKLKNDALGQTAHAEMLKEMVKTLEGRLKTSEEEKKTSLERIEKCGAEIEELKKKIDELTLSQKQSEAYITFLQEQMKKSTDQVTQLTNCVTKNPINFMAPQNLDQLIQQFALPLGQQLPQLTGTPNNVFQMAVAPGAPEQHHQNFQQQHRQQLEQLALQVQRQNFVQPPNAEQSNAHGAARRVPQNNGQNRQMPYSQMPQQRF